VCCSHGLAHRSAVFERTPVCSLARVATKSQHTTEGDNAEEDYDREPLGA
jgi:hypothetical protein